MIEDDLSTALRRAAKAGKLNHLSMAFSNGMWDVRYRGVDDRDHRKVVHRDPACALYEAVTGRKMVEPKKQPATKVPVSINDDLLGDL